MMIIIIIIIIHDTKARHWILIYLPVMETTHDDRVTFNDIQNSYFGFILVPKQQDCLLGPLLSVCRLAARLKTQPCERCLVVYDEQLLMWRNAFFSSC